MTQATEVTEVPALEQQAPIASPRRHCLDLDDFTRDEIEDVLQNTRVMREVLSREIRKVPTLRGKSVVTIFYEASTRTRVSFEEAAKIMSADAINVSASGSSVSSAWRMSPASAGARPSGKIPTRRRLGPLAISSRIRSSPGKPPSSRRRFPIDHRRPASTGEVVSSISWP